MGNSIFRRDMFSKQQIMQGLLMGLLLAASVQPACAGPEPTQPVMPARVGGDFTLTDHNGQPYALSAARGKLVLLFFGYTSCPDICPTTMLTIQTLLSRLGKRAEQVQPLFVSVDPARDTPAVLKQYLAYFHPSIIGLTGNSADLQRVTRQFSTIYRDPGNRPAGNYVVDHSSNMYVIDAAGVLSGIFPYGTPTDTIYETLLAQLPGNE
jgi:protein SCO1/2